MFPSANFNLSMRIETADAGMPVAHERDAFLARKRAACRAVLKAKCATSWIGSACACCNAEISATEAVDNVAC